MKVMPTVDQFPTFADTKSWLMKETCQCIWYLPDKKRCCMVGITDEYNKAALDQVKAISDTSLSVKEELLILAEIAEKCCCSRHHSNKIWGSNLNSQLASRWQNEISSEKDSHSSTLREPSESPEIPELKHEKGLVNKSLLEHLPLSHTGFVISATKAVIFARHEAWKGETLLSKLMEPIDSNSTKIGSVYLYTHTEKTFFGFIKVGFTGRPRIRDRLDEWAKCGHGNPVLLKSYNDIRHPERIEQLVHLELARCRYDIRWCKFHKQSHIEWFQIAFEVASLTVHLWSQWMKRANPYDRRGTLKSFWKETILFLTNYDIPITAGLMIQIQEIEEGSSDLPDFIKDDKFWKRKKSIVKQET
jgi:hypothetical protein